LHSSILKENEIVLISNKFSLNIWEFVNLLCVGKNEHCELDEFLVYSKTVPELKLIEEIIISDLMFNQIQYELTLIV
jgi:hypothetical protein